MDDSTQDRAAHTPGFGELSTWRDSVIVGTVPQNTTWRLVCGFDQPEYGGKYLIAESVLDARFRNLFIAAPDLLAALEKSEEFMSGFEDPDEADTDGINAALSTIRAAIAKARGNP